MDINTLQHIGRATYEPYYQHIWYPGGVEWYINRCFNPETLEKELNDPSIEYSLPTDEQGNIIGLLKVHPLYPTPDGSIEDALYLEKIYLMPDYFGKGMGQKLLQQVEQQAIALGRKAIWLQVMHNAAIVEAYAKAGFRITGPTRFEFDLLKEEERDGWIMVKPLPFPLHNI
jgi:ribosomal protein S18 acetylase RimI-like enzyme